MGSARTGGVRRGVMVALTVAFGLGASTEGRASELLLSEYVEGSSNNKALELYNASEEAADLLLEEYVLQFYFNGNTSPLVTTALEGSVAPFGTFVVADNDANADILAAADQVSNSSFFNGDDVIVLTKAGAVVDSIGQIGVDPGSSWPVDTQNVTLRRLPGVCTGDTEPADAYTTASEWELFEQDDVSDLGLHDAECGGSADVPPRLLTSVPANGTSQVELDTLITLTFSESVSVDDSGLELWCEGSGLVSTVLTGAGEAYTLQPETELPPGDDCVLTIAAEAVLDDAANPMAEGVEVVFSTEALPSFCGDPATLISAVQGTGQQSPMEGVEVTVEGIVVGEFQGADRLRGFFLQEEDEDADGDPASSEGLFVYTAGAGPSVVVGERVRVRGVVVEYFGFTELTEVSEVQSCDLGNRVTPASPNLPVDSAASWEAFEGMAVRFGQTLYATESYNLGRYGQLLLASEGRLFQGTNVAEPGAAALAVEELNTRRSILLDDGSAAQNPTPVPFLAEDNTFRLGDSVQELTGVLYFAFGDYQVVPTAAVGFERLNSRSSEPELPEDGLRVASFNVLNYFTTLDDGAAICGPDQAQDCRGADSAVELTRQRAKLLSALDAIQADIVGLMELENNTSESISDLVSGLSELSGKTYNYVDTGTIGDDAIKVGIVFDEERVAPIGPFAILDSGVDPNFNDQKNRPVLAQSFEVLEDGEVFTLAVNHLKSKGSGCDDLVDPDIGDGQGNCNLTRTAAAVAEANWLASDPTGIEDPDVLILGDMNAYAKEDPITALTSMGFTNLIETYNALPFELGEGDSYSYVFGGRFGYLDHALASGSLLAQIRAVTEWHINSDESRIFDYNEEFNPPELYSPDAFRSSDHDPVIVTLQLKPAVPLCDGRPATIWVDDSGVIVGGPMDGEVYRGLLRGIGGGDVVVGTEGNDLIVLGNGGDTVCALAGGDLVVGRRGDNTVYAGPGADFVIGGPQADALYGEAGMDVLLGGGGNDQLVGGTGIDTVIGGRGKDTCVDPEQEDHLLSCEEDQGRR